MADTDLLFSDSPNRSGDLLFGATDTPVEPPLPEPVGITDLVFGDPPKRDGNLVFGDDGTEPEISDSTIYGVLDAGEVLAAGRVVLGVSVSGAIDVGMPMPVGQVNYFTDTQRPLVGTTKARYQAAAAIETGVEVNGQEGLRLMSGVQVAYEDGLKLRTSAAVVLQDARRLDNTQAMRFQDGAQLQASALIRHQDAKKASVTAALRAQDGLGLGRAATTRYQDASRIDNAQRVRFQEGLFLEVGRTEREGYGRAVEVGFTTRYQDGIRPPAGRYEDAIIAPPVQEPCYTPDTNLVFTMPWPAGDANLVFICDNHDTPPPEPGETIIVPVREVYLVLNTSSLHTADGVFLPTYGMSMSLDVDSWTWSFNASLPFAAYNDVKHAEDGTPVEVECMVNGVPYRFKIKTISRDRSFASDGISITGRGISDELDAPTAPVMNFSAGGDRTAQQLMADVLSLNGVPLDWSVDWQLTDWLVPGGTWTKSGTYIEALNAIAAAAGGYIQPTPSTRALRVLPRFPLLPRDWATMAPIDYELPDTIAIKESTEWVEKPRYNRVYVQGQKNGVRGRVTLAGSAGDVNAPTVVDSLVTHADAARQRGLSILGDTGRIANVGLNTAVGIRDSADNPIGIIPPGKFVRYVENGVAKIGLTRSVNVTIGTPEIEQSIGVEFHEFA